MTKNTRYKSSRKRSSGPDFICIGMQKAATRWLYDQLRSHNEFWMPPLKELHFFDAGFNFKACERLYRNAVSKRTLISRLTMGRQARSDFNFFKICLHDKISADLKRHRIAYLNERRESACNNAEYTVFTPSASHINWYRRIFNIGSKLSGDITPAYSTLNTTQIKTVYDAFPDTKIILLIRNPVDRAWSYLLMRQRMREKSGRDLETIDVPETVINILETDDAARLRSFPSRTYRNWVTSYPTNQIGVFFFDDIASDPLKERTKIIRFLEANDDPAQFTVNPEYDKKQKTGKRSMPNNVRSALYEHFDQEILEIRRLFGGAAENWNI